MLKSPDRSVKAMQAGMPIAAMVTDCKRRVAETPVGDWFLLLHNLQMLETALMLTYKPAVSR